MGKNPLVTVLMTVYNGGDYLNASVQSILNQTFKDFEFLIVNDCSTDESLEVIRSFEDKRIRIHNNEENLGQTKSLNIGLKLARGRYIARMDADDMALPLWLEKSVSYMKDNPEYAAVGSAAIVIDGKGKKKEIRRAPVQQEDIIFRIFFAPPMNHVSVLLNKELIMKNGGYDEQFKITQDYELWSSLIRNNYTIANIPDILVVYRVHTKSIGFMEANKKGLEEKSETIFRNVNSLTCQKITHEGATEICKFFYQTPVLTSDEFNRARKNFEGIYSNIKDEFMLPPGRIHQKVKHQMLKPYCKLAVHEIQNVNMAQARRLALDYCRIYGYHVMPLLLFFSTFAGYGASRKIPFLYEKWQEMATRLFLKINTGMWV